METREVRYCTTSDGVQIAFCVEGDGPALLWCPIFVESFALADENAPYRAFLGELTRRWRLIRYDPRGIGLSEREPEDLSNDALVRDIEAVTAAAGADEFALWSPVLSGCRGAAYAARHPQNVTHLILYDALSNPHTDFAFEAAKGLAELAKANWRVATDTIAGLGGRASESDPAVRQLFSEVTYALARTYERSTEGAVAARFVLEPYESWDVSDLLPQIECPTLVVHHLSNQIFPFEAGKRIAVAIPGSRFVTPEGIWANPVWDHVLGNGMFETVERFLPARETEEEHAPTQRAFKTVLFTDICDHTVMMQRLGDAKGRDVLREHERITRETFKAHNGAEVKSLGDGFMASFTSVSQAVDCAIALQRSFAAWSGPDAVQIRVGLNAGEPIEEDGDLFGSTVILAARITAKAGAGEILIPEPLRHLLTGKSYVYADRGETVLKGFEDAIRLFEVHWQE